MKKINLIKGLWNDSHEKQTPQTFGRYAVMLLMLLTLGVGQMWADAWVCRKTDGGEIATKTVGDKLNGGSEWLYKFETNGGWGSASDVQVLVGTSNSQYTTVNADWEYDSGDNKGVKGDIGSVTFDRSGKWYAVGKYYDCYTQGKDVWCRNTTLSMTGNTPPYWTVNPPAVSSFSVARSGYLAGSGTSEDPYLVASGSTLTLTGSGSQAISDANSSVNYKFGSDAYSTTATKNITVTSSGSIAVKARCKNTSASLDGAETETITIYYAPVSVKDITVYIYVGGHTEGDINSVEMNGCTPYVGTKALTAVKINNRAAGDPKFTLSGNWLYYTFTNVTKVSNITCARSGGNIFTGEITDNVYYTYEGASLPGQCIARTTPTWNVAPANGAAGGSMTATINNVPDGATVTWSSSATSYATVDDGLISYVAAGSATISARIQKAADGDYCALDETISQAITVTSGATVSATRACPEYVSTNSGQVKLDISSTGASTGWYYRVCNSTKTAYYAPDEQSAASNTLSWTMNGSLPTGSNTLVVELYNSARQLVCTSSSVTVNVEIAESVTISAGANGSVSPSGTVYANNNHVHPTITAIPDEHYHFKNWTSSNAAASVADANNATTTVTATASGCTITANFAGDQYTITYKDQGDVAYSGSNEGSLPATHTYGTATALVNGTKNGYNFVEWYTDASCTISAGSSIGATAKTSNFTLYAKWTENMSALSTSCSYNAGTPGYAAPTVSNSATNVGYVTTRTITATAAGTGYTFAGWTLTNCTRTDGGGATANPITVRSNGDGAAVTVVANYNEVLTTNWYISGDGNGTGTDLTPGSPFSGWGTSGTRMQKKSGYSTVEKYYCTFNVTTLATTDDHFPFQVYDGTNHRGYNGYWITKENNSTTVYTGNPTNMKFRPYIAGTYEFEVDNTGANPVLTVHWPVINQLRISSASPADATNVNNFDLADKGSNNWSVKRTLNANTTYTFKMVYDGAWYGDGHAFTRASNTTTGLEDGDNMTLKTDVAGEYTFTFNSSSKNLEITYPAAYTVTYGVGTSYTSMGSASTSPSVTSGNYVLAGTEVAFTATPNLGYKFVGWYREAACTNLVSASNPYEQTINANTTLYAKFEYRVLYIHADWLSWGTAQMTQSTVDRAIYTYEIDPLAVKSGTPSTAEGGHHFHFVNTADNPNDHKAYDYYGVHTPTGSGYLVDGDIHLTDPGNATIQFDLTRKSKITITLTLQTIDDATKPTLNIDADPYYTVNTAKGGSGTAGTSVSPASVEARSGANSAEITASINPGYSLVNWTASSANITINSPNSTTTTVRASADGTITANARAHTYTIHFNGHGNTGGGTADQAAVVYDVSTALTANGFTKTGYTFAGWATSEDGEKVYDDEDSVLGLTTTDNGTVNLWAVWTPNPYTVVLDKQTSAEGYGGNAGTVTNQTVTFDATPAAVSGTMPSAANGYAFMGFYSATGGNGRRFIDPSGNWVTSAGDTISGGNWVHDGDVTLYAYYKKAEITNLALDAATVEPEATVGVTPTISPTPAGTTIICWEVQYAATGNPLSPQPGMTWSAGKLTFDAPAASGLYKIVATLKTGDDCDGGTTLSSSFVNFQVAGSHTVTVAYKYSGTDIAASTSVTGRPLDWSDPITAPDIFGYTFDHWTAGDGITLSEDGESDFGEDESSSATIYIKAIYDGTLTANYTPKSLIYFKNTLGWSSVYVNFYGEDGYWDDKGSGNKSVTNRNKAMSRIGETDVWYYDYGAASITPTKWVAFTQDSQNGDGSGAQNFWASGTGEPVSYPARRADDLADKAGETGFYAATPMFVPLAGQTPITKNESGGGKALYYNSGYWTKYLPGTGYTLEIYNAAGNSKLKEMDFSSADELMPMKAVADLEANTTYKFQIKRHGDVYLGNSGTMTYTNHGQSTPWEMTNSGFSMCGITTTAAGDYTFNFSYSANASNQYRLRISVDYPVADGDYRLVYTDGTRSGRLKPSAIVQKENDGSAIVSFFVRHNQTPVLRIQQASVDGSGNITWNEYPTSGTPTNQITGAIASAITKDTVYNFNLSMNGSGALSVAGVEYYSGNYYIRTDAANSKWDNYRTDPDHLMTYSEYLKSDVGYTHYYTHWVNKDDVGRKNVKFVIANDYSPCISDTLARETASGTWANIATFMEEGGDLKRSANVRFMWDIKTNNIARAYIDGAQEDGSEFLLLLSSDSKIKQGETTKTQVTFSDNGNWIYEANIKAQPNAQIKLKSTWGTGGTAIEQYFKGASDDTETLVGGSGDTWYDFRLIYDFKTNRLMASYVPATGTISTDIPINADVMFIREHQGDIAQLTFVDEGAISAIKTAYGVMRFNKWTINNKDKSTHDPLDPDLSRYERDLFYISFPFRVSLEEVFGFGTYGTHWIIEEYDGAGRAEKGFWADSPTFWKFITNRKGKFLEPNTGYLLALDLDVLGEASDVWAHTDQVELYFPSYGNLGNITSSSVTYEVPAHTCNIGPRFEGGDDRRIKDSHWNVMSVPTYINTTNVTFANTTWITEGDGRLGPNFLYEWNSASNTLTARSGVGYTYHAMHAYMVQYCGNVTWSTSVTPAAAPNRNPDAPQDAEYRLELRQNDVAVDQAFVRLSDDEHVTTGFDFNYDLSKEFNKNKANIYTMVTTQMEDGPSITETAGNCLPMSEQTTVVPVGVIAKTTGDYTFAIPEGTNGVGVTLIDNETGIRTSLSALDYTINLPAGTYNERFVLEISPIRPISTDLENTEYRIQNTDVRKVLIDNILYIVKDGVMYDAQGKRLQ